MENKIVSASIEPIKVNGQVLNYRMYMKYNGVDFCFLNSNPEDHTFASEVKSEMSCETDGITYTDGYGLIAEKDNHNSTIGYVTGINNITNSLVGMAVACKSLKIQSDLSVHFNDEDYRIVRDTNELTAEAKRNTITLGTKDFDAEEFFRLDHDIREVTENMSLLDQKRR